MEVFMKKLLVLTSMLLSSISTAIAAKPATNEPKKQTLLETLKKENLVKIKTSDSSQKTGSTGGNVGPKVTTL
jgi:hypothetical protein